MNYLKTYLAVIGTGIGYIGIILAIIWGVTNYAAITVVVLLLLISAAVTWVLEN